MGVAIGGLFLFECLTFCLVVGFLLKLREQGC